MSKILIVEDEESLLKVLTDAFSGEGYTVNTAKDGNEGLMSVSKDMPDLILLDILMPNIDGMEMLRRLKNNSQTYKIPVILLTNAGETSKILEAKELGAEDYLIKSNLKIEDVVNLVKGRI